MLLNMRRVDSFPSTQKKKRPIGATVRTRVLRRTQCIFNCVVSGAPGGQSLMPTNRPTGHGRKGYRASLEN